MSTSADYSAGIPQGPRSARLQTGQGGLLPGVACLAAAVLAMLQQEHIRSFEAWAMAWVFDRALGGSSYSVRDIIFHNIGGGHPFALMVTGLCSSSVLIAPILALSGVLFLMGRIAVPRLARAAFASLLIVVFSNALRYFMIAGAQQAWGEQGFSIMHHFFGSFVVIIGFVAAILVLVRAGKTSRGRRAA
ncbi:exosortase S [Arthrobacter sp. AZCC_0090]|uniref:exosortase S n=1 Tax=Arthrobacter sp. AZCC_0090 TaxID=2735881 RepID=UPI0016176B32|nr:exosortase S [Arthrobacter sp. AZCC_0090]MBB6404361.1 exosortase/archaeosortase family protein [Arthrobacter sp. AZCC_0090]